MPRVEFRSTRNSSFEFSKLQICAKIPLNSRFRNNVKAILYSSTLDLYQSYVCLSTYIFITNDCLAIINIIIKKKYVLWNMVSAP